MAATPLFGVAWLLAAGAAAASSPELLVDGASPLPYFLGGQPQARQAHPYGPGVPIAPHTAEGPGLSTATTGHEASFTIRLAIDSDGAESEGETEPRPEETEWNVDKKRFIYVWIASEDNIFIAGVEREGDGRTLTATYESSFPGDYLVHVEDVDLRARDRSGKARPITGSPFALTITGEPTVDVDALPACGALETEGGAGVGEENGELGDVAASFWRAGSWVSSSVASAEHGVLRDGWVFQPKDCVHDTFSYEDLMQLAGLEEETWLLAMGNSILRGSFLSLVDMALARGQKEDLDTSAVQKCWGFADVRIGNLRLTYQDLRLYTVTSVEDATVCNNEKLESGSTAAYVGSVRLFLQETVFKDGEPWPNVIWAPSNMVDTDEAPNFQITVLMDALPANWKGALVMLDHLYAYGYGWNTANPTLPTLEGVNPINERSQPSSDHGLGRMSRYRGRHPRVTFMSVIPMYQAKLFENQESRNGLRCFGCSIHYHYVSNATSPESYGGSKMVHSSITEMLANVMIAKAVGTKAALYERVAASPNVQTRSAEVRRTFELCTDCPATLLPYHVKPVPAPVCQTVASLPGNATVGVVWDAELCPDWCLATDPVGETPTVSGPVSVRVCGAVAAAAEEP